MMSKDRLTMAYMYYRKLWKIYNLLNPAKTLYIGKREEFQQMKQIVDTYNAEREAEEFRPLCSSCAYNDEGCCSCFDKKSICCPYAE